MFTTSSIALSLIMAVSAGLMGAYVVMRRMTLSADALSHVALPGIGLAIVLGLHSFVGAFVMLLLGTLLIWGLEQRTKLATETVIGVVFSTALAAGSLMASGEELIDALLGGRGDAAAWELAAASAIAAAVIAFLIVRRHQLVVTLVSPEIASASGIAVRRLELWFLLALAATVALGLRYLGVLLMGSLVIIPAATARRLARSLAGMLITSAVLAVLATGLGTWLGARLHHGTGAPIIVVAAVGFFLSLLRR